MGHWSRPCWTDFESGLSRLTRPSRIPWDGLICLTVIVYPLNWCVELARGVFV